MDELFKTFEPAVVKGLMEELFTGYINSQLCCPDKVGEIYELKRLLDIQAEKEAERRNKNEVTTDRHRVQERPCGCG